MAGERNIGHIVMVDSLTITIQLDDDIKSMYKSGYQEIYPVARINSYVIVPVGADRIVAMVNRVITREDASLATNNAIFLSKSSRLLYATMLGTIGSDKEYKSGVYNYPILDNPVWYAVREDLNCIFDQKNGDNIDYGKDYYLPIGTSPTFPDYKVKINPDKFFAKHAAILGNTGSGKSCTLSSILQSIFRFTYAGEKKLQSAHVVIFDTNGEYAEAFDLKDTDIVNPFVMGKEDVKVPYWFMNFADMDYLFEPTSGTQAPILKRVLSMAKSGFDDKGKYVPLSVLAENYLCEFITAIESNTFRTKSAIYSDGETILKLISEQNESSSHDFTNTIDALKKICDERKTLNMSDKGYVSGTVNFVTINSEIKRVKEDIDGYLKEKSQNVTSENRNIDFPLFYKFENLLGMYLDYAIRESSVSEEKMREYISTLKLRMRSYVDDKRMAQPLMLDKQDNFEDSLAKFLAFVLGDYARVFHNKKDVKDPYGSRIGDENSRQSQVTVIDMSMLPYQVLETITGLIGRLMLEFLSRFPEDKRGSMPVVIVLEEAQNYIPEQNRKDRDSISKLVFERIAREGRKFGLSLVVSSQRPSELSKTVLSQCNSFVIHRIQNPDDQQYIRKLVSAASGEVLSQLPTLPQQFAIVMGDAVRTPVVTRINDANPIPKSDSPKIVEHWLSESIDSNIYKDVSDRWIEKGNVKKNEEDKNAK